jgi:hypothetical protein
VAGLQATSLVAQHARLCRCAWPSQQAEQPGPLLRRCRWVAVGHASGALMVWDLGKRTPRLVTSIIHHGLPVSHCSFFPGELLLRRRCSAAQGPDAGCGRALQLLESQPLGLGPGRLQR